MSNIAPPQPRYWKERYAEMLEMPSEKAYGVAVENASVIDEPLAVSGDAIKRDKVRFAIAFYLMSGWLPWAPHGKRFATSGDGPSLSLCGSESGQRPARWILCCGHTLSPAEGERWIAAGVAAEGKPDKFGRRTLVKGPALETWIAHAWDGLRAKTWGAQ